MARQATRLTSRHAPVQGIHALKIQPGAKADEPRQGLVELPIFRDWIYLLCVAGVAVVAMLLRGYEIGRAELWLDEAASHYYATTPIRMGNGILYYLLLRGWIHIAGQSESALRLLSAIFGALTVVGVMWLGRVILGRWAGVWAGAFAAVSPIHIYYSQEVRSYSLVTFLLVLIYGMLWRALETDNWRYWALFSACVVLACYSHVFAVLGIVPAAFLPWFWSERQLGSRKWLHYGESLLLCLVLFMPWLLGGRSLEVGSRSGSAWIREIWESTPPLLAIPLSLEVFGLGGQVGLLPIQLKQFTLLAFPRSLRFLGLGAFLLLGIWAASPWGDKDFDVAYLAKRKAWLWLLLIGPLGGMWLLSLHKPLYVVGRYDLMAFPAFALLVGMGLRKTQRAKTGRSLLTSLIVLLLLVPITAKLFLYYRAPLLEDARPTAQVIDTSVGNGDIVIFTGLRGLSVLYYLHRMGYHWDKGSCEKPGKDRRFACRMFPRGTEQKPAIFDPEWIFDSAGTLQDTVQDLLKSLPSKENALWVVFAGVSAGREMDTLQLATPDRLLVKELLQYDLDVWRARGVEGVYRFRQLAGG